MKKREYQDYIQDIVDACGDIEKFIVKMKFEEFRKDRKTTFAVTKAIEVIGEAVKNVPEYVKARYFHIPWKAIAGMRNKLAHEYFGIDLKVLWETAANDVPALKKDFERINRIIIKNKG